MATSAASRNSLSVAQINWQPCLHQYDHTDREQRVKREIAKRIERAREHTSSAQHCFSGKEKVAAGNRWAGADASQLTIFSRGLAPEEETFVRKQKNGTQPRFNTYKNQRAHTQLSNKNNKKKNSPIAEGTERDGISRARQKQRTRVRESGRRKEEEAAQGEGRQ